MNCFTLMRTLRFFSLLISVFISMSATANEEFILFPSSSISTFSSTTRPGVVAGTTTIRDIEIDESELRELLDLVNENKTAALTLVLPALTSEHESHSIVQPAISGDATQSYLRISGAIEGDLHSSALINIHNGKISFLIRSQQGSMTGVWKENNVYQLKSVISSSGFNERPPLVVQREASVGPSLNSQSAVEELESGGVVDFLVVYTADAVTRAGGLAMFEQGVSLAVEDTNIGFADSDIDLELRVVASEETAYQETNDTALDLNRLISTTDGFMDEVHELRNLHGADLVMLMIGDGDQFCGRAVYGYAGSKLNLLPEYGFSILAEYCIQTTIFAHELGHNFGAQHDRFTNSSGGIFEYSHGYTAPSESWHTIMAYPNGCNFNCVGINRWSNPNQLYNGETLGVPIGDSNAADNVTTLSMTKTSVANFRLSQDLTTLCNGLQVTVDLNQGQSPGPGNDVVLGTPGDDDIRGRAGNDTICGMGGDDFIHGNSGDDWIDGGDGVDNIRGGQGADILFSGSGATVDSTSRVFGGTGDDSIFGGPDADDLRGGRGDDMISGEQGADSITGNEDDDILYGGPGADTLKGGNGENDQLFGEDDIDSLNGGSGSNDFCDSGGQSGDIDTNCEVF